MSKTLKDLILESKPTDREEDNQYLANSYKEVLQKVFLTELAVVGFFELVAFHGGTCLRLIDRIDRFSEDLDFIGLGKIDTEEIKKKVEKAQENLAKKGVVFEVTHKAINSTVQKIWIKDSVIVKEFLCDDPEYVNGKKVKIKIEVDIEPPAGSVLEKAIIDFPRNTAIVIQDHSSSFSGKLHAVLCRDYFYETDKAVKGRDYFDLNWYLEQGTEPNIELLNNALFKGGPWKKKEIKIDRDWIYAEVKKKLESLKWDIALNDMEPFLLTGTRGDLAKILNTSHMVGQLEKWYGKK